MANIHTILLTLFFWGHYFFWYYKIFIKREDRTRRDPCTKSSSLCCSFDEHVFLIADLLGQFIWDWKCYMIISAPLFQFCQYFSPFTFCHWFIFTRKLKDFLVVGSFAIAYGVQLCLVRWSHHLVSPKHSWRVRTFNEKIG